MSALTIGRLSAAVERPADLTRVDRMQRRLAEAELQDRQAGSHGLTGEWCVRRIELLLPLRADELDTTAGARWADQIAAAVRELTPDGRLVLHYRTRGQALADLVDRVLAGDTGRAWAWRQLGLLPAGGPDPASDPAAAVISALGTQPGIALALIPDLARRHRFERLDQLLGETGWRQLAAAVDLPLTERPPAGPSRSAAARTVLADSTVIAAARRLPARPADPRTPVWAALAVAEVCPGRPSLVPLVTQLLRADASPGSARDDSRPGASTGSAHDDSRPGASAGSGRGDSRPGASAGSAHDESRPGASIGSARASSRSGAPGGSVRDDSRPGASTGSTRASSRPDASTGSARVGSRPELVDWPTASPPEFSTEALTSWGGLLYLLNTADAAGIPECAEVEPSLARRTTRWILHALAQRVVPVTPGDPAALALAGLPPDAEPPTGPDPSADEEAALAAYAERWTSLTLDRLAAAGETDASTGLQLWAVARRPARIVADPGWLEAEFDLDEVDLAIRRAGLDLDPGWLDWLGMVVRFRYV